jgi:DNA-binding transcriptional LysR family regulator
MNPRDLPDLVSFATVARCGGFARAAAEMGVSRSALSHAIRGLETRLGVRLLNRTTRSVSLTAAGERMLAEVAPALERIGSAIEGANGFRDRPAGRVRLSVPRVAAALALIPALPSFLAAHPDVEVELSIDDAAVDIVAKGFDAGVRFGELLAGDMMAVAIGPPVEFAVVGAPAYFRDRPVPQEPAELAGHRCIRLRLRGSGALYDWEFERDGRELRVAVEGPLTLDSSEYAVRAAVGGIGLAFAAVADVGPRLASGELIRVLADWCPPTARLYLYYPGRRHVPAALRALIDWLRR